MVGVSVIITASLTVFGTVGVGALVRRLGWLTEEADRSLTRLIVNLLMPALILDKLLGNPVLARADNLLLAPMVGAVTVCLGFGVAALAARWGRIGDDMRRRTFSFTVGMYNYGYIPIPLVLALFDRETAGVLFLHNLGVELAMWSVGIWILSGSGQGWRSMINGPVLGVVSGVLITKLGWAEAIPTPVTEIIRGLGACSIPLALITSGAIIVDLVRPGLFLEGLRGTLLTVAVRLAILPVLMLGLMMVVPGSPELKQVMIIEAAMPCAVFPIVLARHYGGDVPTAVRALVVTSVISILSTPAWIFVGLRLLP